MSATRAITLLSDFGSRDGYVGMMKGAIAQINPTLQTIDLTHHIPPQEIAQARFVLMSAFPYFPPGTVHLAVVDPGVGSARRGVAIAVGTTEVSGLLVGPDNGLFSGIVEQYSVLEAVELNNPRYWRTPQPSHTFHGRDIFASIAAHLASGVPLQHLGQSIAPATLTRLSLPALIYTENTILGRIQAIDHFGNLITTIPAAAVIGCEWTIDLEDEVLPGVTTYSDRPTGTLVGLIGSHGWVEIAIVNGNAHQRLKLEWGDPVKLVLPPTKHSDRAVSSNQNG
ncbi:MAG: SAM-dependent chlorinase/fluorinase [Leptolyngbyaceae cyanobacterium bins.302]|nr:SAM-dependent chlorinase/fluorinase [Leptolyngbyaceae cyanobacterium bins.302]